MMLKYRDSAPLSSLLSAHSVRPRKIPEWIVVVQGHFSVNKRARKKSNGFLSVFVFIRVYITFDFNGFYPHGNYQPTETFCYLSSVTTDEHSRIT